MKNKLFVGLSLLLIPCVVNAHVQWFVTPEEMKQVQLPWDLTTLWLSGIVMGCMLLAMLLTYSPFLWHPLKTVTSAQIPIKREIYTSYFFALIGTFFILLLLKGGFLAPNLILPSAWLEVGLVLQAALVVTAMFSTVLAGSIMLMTSIFMVVIFPFQLYINYIFEFISLGVFMILAGANNCTIDRWVLSNVKLNRDTAWNYAVRVLRIGIGGQLVILALTEKLINPGLALVFVDMFPFYNFFLTIGWSAVTNLHFVYFIGIAELVLGLLLLLGIANRLVMLALACAFTATAIIHGIHEIEGHLPIFAAAVILLLECRNGENIKSISLPLRLQQHQMS